MALAEEVRNLVVDVAEVAQMFFDLRKQATRWFGWGVLMSFMLCGTVSAQEYKKTTLNPSGIILHYYGFGDDVGSVGIPLYRLEEHLQILTENGYHLERLATLISRINNRDKTLTPRTVAVMVSGASETFFTRGWDKFEQYNVPVTVFVPVDSVGKAGLLGWDNIREMTKMGTLDVGIQGRILQNLLQVPADKLEKDLLYAKQKVKDELGVEAKLFSYPYGITGTSLNRLVYKAGFVAGIGQHSGAFDYTHNRFFLPSFGMTHDYSDETRLKLVLSTRALAVRALRFDSLVAKDKKLPELWIEYDKPLTGEDVNMSCFHSQQGRLNVEKKSEGFSPIFVSPLSKGRSRLNCTSPFANRATIWFGYQFYVPG